MERKKVYFVSGIDTDAGKSYATGYLASRWRKEGLSVITQKLIQTGCPEGEVSEDIRLHRRVMDMELLPEDLDHTTCPLRFTYPASPDLAARIDGRQVDLSLAYRSTEALLKKYDIVLVEGAGGLMVPVDGFYLMIDYARERGMPVILVTNPKLGSVNHTLLSLEACRTRRVEVAMLAYNYFPQTSHEITDDTRSYLRRYLAEFHPDCEFMDIPFLKN